MRWIVLALALAVPGVALPQTLALRTADPELGPHRILALETGVDLWPGVSFPLSGLRGDLFRAPIVAVRYGVGGIVEVQLTGGGQFLRIDDRGEGPFAGRVEVDGDVARDLVDPVVGTKLRLREERGGWPALGLRFESRLPAASNESGLGNDTIDFLYWLLAGKTLGSTRLLANVGAGVLSAPQDGDTQNDVLLYGAAIRTALGDGWSVFAEVQGREDRRGGPPPPGTEDSGHARLGAGWSGRSVDVHAALVAGLHEPDPDLGATVSATTRWRIVP